MRLIIKRYILCNRNNHEKFDRIDRFHIMNFLKELLQKLNYPAIFKKKKKTNETVKTKNGRLLNNQSNRNEVIVNRENYNELITFTRDIEISITRDRRKTGVKSVDLILG